MRFSLGFWTDRVEHIEARRATKQPGTYQLSLTGKILVALAALGRKILKRRANSVHAISRSRNS